MKNIIRHKYLTAAAVAMVLISCEREITDTTPRNQDLSNTGQLKIVNAALGTARNYVYVDNNLVSGAPLDFNTSFPAATSTSGIALTPGAHTLLVKDTSATATQTPVTLNLTVEAGKLYTVYQYDSVPGVKSVVSAINLPAATDTAPKVRAGHFAYLKSGTPPAIDIFSKSRNANIFSNVAYGTLTDFITVNTGMSDTLIVRQAGSTTLNLDTLVFGTSQRRIYTLVFNGRYMNNVPGTGLNPRTLTVTTNY